MKPETFARYVFWAAAVWGVLTLTPLYFIFDRIGAADPPPITHPGFYYGFVATALSWQVLFAVIGRDPWRYVGIMPVAVLEKFSYAITGVVLYAQQRMHGSDLVFAGADAILGVLFLVVYARLRRCPATSRVPTDGPVRGIVLRE
jgi:hypothetical protein